MSDEAKKKTAFEFIESNKTAVIATVSAKNEPSAALVFFHFKPDNELYFMTKKSSLKYANIMQNKRVGIVIGTANEPVTVQMQGSAEIIEDMAESKKIMEKLLGIATTGNENWPAIMRQADKEAPCVFKVVIDWMQLYDARNLIHLGSKENIEAITTIIP